MSTTGANFVKLTASALVGTANAATGYLLASSPAQASADVNAQRAELLDRFTVDLARADYAKNGAVLLNLLVSTPVTIDLTDLTPQAVRAGDSSFASWKEIIFKNTGANPVAVGPGASNPLTTPLGGTSPTQTLAAGEWTRWQRPAGVVVDSTHKTLKIDPGAAVAQIAVIIGGS